MLFHLRFFPGPAKVISRVKKLCSVYLMHMMFVRIMLFIVLELRGNVELMFIPTIEQVICEVWCLIISF